jgi:hypothetical protein
LFDFADILIKTIKNSPDYSKYLKIILDNIVSRDIAITSFNSVENSLFWKLWVNWDIHYRDTLDFAYPVYTNIWWAKTDRYYNRSYSKKIKINPDCSINTNIEIIWFHWFTKDKEEETKNIINKFNIKDNNILYIQWKTDNKAFVQIVLPKEANIKNKNNFSIKKDWNIQIVQFFTKTRRLEKIKHNIEYSLENKSCKPYSFKLYKQPWILNYDIEINNNKFNWIKKDFIYNN